MPDPGKPQTPGSIIRKPRQMNRQTEQMLKAER